MKSTTFAHAYVYAHVSVYACASVWLHCPVGDRLIRCFMHLGLMFSVLVFGSPLHALERYNLCVMVYRIFEHARNMFVMCFA